MAARPGGGHPIHLEKLATSCGNRRRGGVLLVLGIAMLVLPGPGILVVALGFAILGTEYAWAAAALERAKRVAAQAGGIARDGATRAAQAREAQPKLSDDGYTVASPNQSDRTRGQARDEFQVEVESQAL